MNFVILCWRCMIVDVLNKSSLGVSQSVTQFFVGLLQCDAMCRDCVINIIVIVDAIVNRNCQCDNFKLLKLVGVVSLTLKRHMIGSLEKCCIGV